MSNKDKIITVARRLGELKDQLVFVGGSIVELLQDDDYAMTPRISYDVDTIVEVGSFLDYSKLEKKLRQLGFKNVINDNIICRWQIDDVLLDVTPTDKKILGFSNKWYKDAYQQSVAHKLSENLEIKLISAPYFIATKIVAFYDRGNGDFILSHDCEDIISVLDGRKIIYEDIAQSPLKLQKFIAHNFKEFYGNYKFKDALPGHLANYATLVAERCEYVEKIMLKIIKSNF